MAVPKSKNFTCFMLFCLLLVLVLTLQGVAAFGSTPVSVSYDTRRNRTLNLQTNFPRGESWKRRELKREMIGSVAPTCTYNECRGCKYRCRAEQVPVEGNDPMNSPYHYKCVCHR